MPTTKGGILTPTAIVHILGEGISLRLRALVDWCSDTNYITSNVCQLLKLKTKRCEAYINGVNDLAPRKINQLTRFLIDLDNEQVEVNAFVVPKLMKGVQQLQEPEINITGLELADPDFYMRRNVQVLIGGAIARELLLPKQIKIDNYFLQDSKMGYLVMGGTEVAHSQYSTYVTQIQDVEMLRKFFDAPLIEEEMTRKEEDELAEKIYKEKVTRLPCGRFMVGYPFKPNHPKIKRGYNRALKYYLAQEQRLKANPTMKEASDKFMKEYLDMGHMEIVKDEDIPNENAYYMQYMAIYKKDAITTKLRNVFNCSAKADSTRMRLNDLLLKGPKLQTSITKLITSARIYEHVFSGDISKMFRQIAVRPEERDYFRILWRPSPNENIKTYRHTTVTYGSESAPYLSIRTIHHVADTLSNNEKTKTALKSHIYVDDLYHGQDTIEESRQLLNDIVATLDSAKMPLTKLNASDPEILKDIEEGRKLTAYIDDKDKPIKILGVNMDRRMQTFFFTFEKIAITKLSKRKMLSITNTWYDPLGFCLPVIVYLRMVFQAVWQIENMSWEDNVPLEIKTKFENCINEMYLLNKLKIKRWFEMKSNEFVELIGFSDASQSAIAACLYVRVKKENGYKVNFIAGKSRLVPLKEKEGMKKSTATATIPKLELEAILALTELYQDYRELFPNHKFYAYTDSEVALAWTRREYANPSAVIERRVKGIKKVLDPEFLNYVATDMNPSDAASRGQLPLEFMAQSNLWLHGPSWLTEKTLPVVPYLKLTTLCTQISGTQRNYVLERLECITNSYDTMVRIIAYMRRFKTRRNGELSAIEHQQAEIALIKLAQADKWSKEIELLKKGRILRKKTWLTSLNIFLDKNDVMRIGGRLDNSDLTFHMKHPMLLPNSRIAKALITTIHEKNLHCHHIVVEQMVREKFWVTQLKVAIRDVIARCFLCRRINRKKQDQFMADINRNRIQPSPAFTHVSVDYFGPYMIKASELPGEKRLIKVWMIIFTCMSTKNCHFEMTFSYDTLGFMAAFRQYTSRRGLCASITSDQGKQLMKTKDLIQSGEWAEYNDQIQAELAKLQIRWITLPAYSPHWGGVHERGVSYFKHYLKRVINFQNLTPQTLFGLLCHAEGLINSRPLVRLTGDNDAFAILTPSHFTIQRAITQLPPIPSAIIDKRTALGRNWLRVDAAIQQLWRKYKSDYLKTLQFRYKWQTPKRNIQVDDLVILHDCKSTFLKSKDYSHPTNWKIALVEKIYPDHYNAVRSCQLKILEGKDKHGKNIFSHKVRAIHTFTRIPSDKEEEEEMSKFPNINPYEKLNERRTGVDNLENSLIEIDVDSCQHNKNSEHVESTVIPSNLEITTKDLTEDRVTNSCQTNKNLPSLANSMEVNLDVDENDERYNNINLVDEALDPIEQDPFEIAHDDFIPHDDVIIPTSDNFNHKNSSPCYSRMPENSGESAIKIYDNNPERIRQNKLTKSIVTDSNLFPTTQPSISQHDINNTADVSKNSTSTSPENEHKADSQSSLESFPEITQTLCFEKPKITSTPHFKAPSIPTINPENSLDSSPVSGQLSEGLEVRNRKNSEVSSEVINCEDNLDESLDVGATDETQEIELERKVSEKPRETRTRRNIKRPARYL